MRLRQRVQNGVWVVGIPAVLALCLSGCDDFKRHPSASSGAGSGASSGASSGAGSAASVAGASSAAIPVINPPPPSALASAAPVITPPAPAAPPPGSANPEAKAIDVAAFAPAASVADRRRALIRAQVILDRAHFSPGVIDGRDGANFRRALAAFEVARQVTGTTAAAASAGTAGVGLDAAGWQALVLADAAPVTQDYVITADDVKGPFLGTVPTDMAVLAKLPRVGYATPLEELAETFHMDEALLRALNPKADFGVAGTSIVVIRPAADPLAQVARIEVDKTGNQLRAYGADGKIEAMFPATVGSTERPAPSGQWAVRTVAPNPDYTYDPSRLTFGNKKLGKLTIPPGPNNPVGSTWIDLTVDTYGIHGAPDPTKVGKTASHGCVRLTNWDAKALGKAVKKGVPVVFVGAAAKKG